MSGGVVEQELQRLLLALSAGGSSPTPLLHTSSHEAAVAIERTSPTPGGDVMEPILFAAPATAQHSTAPDLRDDDLPALISELSRKASLQQEQNAQLSERKYNLVRKRIALQERLLDSIMSLPGGELLVAALSSSSSHHHEESAAPRVSRPLVASILQDVIERFIQAHRSREDLETTRAAMDSGGGGGGGGGTDASAVAPMDAGQLEYVREQLTKVREECNVMLQKCQSLIEQIAAAEVLQGAAPVEEHSQHSGGSRLEVAATDVTSLPRRLLYYKELQERCRTMRALLGRRMKCTRGSSAHKKSSS